MPADPGGHVSGGLGLRVARYSGDMQTSTHSSLTEALGIRRRELVSLVGGGGKSGVLQRLAREASSCGTGDGGLPCVLATTTTAMFLDQLRSVGPVVIGADRAGILKALAGAFVPGGVVAAAQGLAGEGKVRGLPAAWVDRLWADGLAERVIVEADGSRGLSLKAFGPNEPQIPEATTLIVQVAGLDVLGAPLDSSHVHRAELLVAALGDRLGTGKVVSPAVFTAALGLQLEALRERWPRARIVTLLNKAESEDSVARGLQLAEALLGLRPDRVAPEGVAVGSLREQAFVRCVPDSPVVSAVVLAAGRSTRMGEQKLLLPVAGRPMIEAAVTAAVASQAAETIVVVGAEADAVGRALSGHLVRIVANPCYKHGMSTSLRAGLAAARPDAEAVVFVLGDQPFVTADSIDRLIGMFAERGGGIVRSLVDGKPGHPVVMGAEYFSEILALEGDVGAREVLARHPDHVVQVAKRGCCRARDFDHEEIPGDPTSQFLLVGGS